MEQAVERHYKHVVILPEDLKAQIRAGVESATIKHFELSDELRQQFTKQLDKLDKKRATSSIWPPK